MTNLRPSESQLRATIDATRVHSNLKKKNLLGSGINLPWRSRAKKEAKPVKPLERTSAAPTPERQLKPDAAHGWDEQQHPGGQVSYRMRSAVDVYKEHFTEDLVHAADQLMKDADLCTKANLICARTYTGMPYAVSKASLTTDQIDAQARFKWIMGGMDERFRAAVAFLVMGVRSERMGAPRDFAYTASRYRDPTTKNAFTAGFLKAVLIRVKEGQMAYAAHLRWRKEQIAAQKTKLNGARETSPLPVKRL